MCKLEPLLLLPFATEGSSEDRLASRGVKMWTVSTLTAKRYYERKEAVKLENSI